MSDTQRSGAMAVMLMRSAAQHAGITHVAHASCFVMAINKPAHDAIIQPSRQHPTLHMHVSSLGVPLQFSSRSVPQMSFFAG